MHVRTKRIIVDYETEPDLSWLETQDPLTAEQYAANPVLDEDGEVIPWAEYQTYRDHDPQNHLTLMMRIEEKCGECGVWRTIDSLGNIDFLKRLTDADTLTGQYAKPDDITDEYLRSCARDLFGDEVSARSGDGDAPPIDHAAILDRIFVIMYGNGPGTEWDSATTSAIDAVMREAGLAPTETDDEEITGMMEG